VLLNGQAVEHPKGVVDMVEGDILELGLPGGGGYRRQTLTLQDVQLLIFF
jgi:N-methylhydantoinase B/oxoprolinase/acetone carboxylase alpha subunit